MEILSNRILNMAESETLAMTAKARELKAQGKDVISLSIGEPDFNTPEVVKEAAKKAIDDNFTHYPPVPGYPDLREAICTKLRRDNGLEYKPEQIVVSTGAKQSLFQVVQCLINPGDEVIIPTPFWVSYKEFVRLAEGKCVFVKTKLENDFKVTPEQLEAAITPRTKLIMFSSPSNPTGMLYTKEELKGIADVVAKHENLFVMADEIYEHINFVGKHESIAQFPEVKDRVITVNGVAKGFAMTGWRIGFIAAPTVIAKAPGDQRHLLHRPEGHRLRHAHGPQDLEGHHRHAQHLPAAPRHGLQAPLRHPRPQGSPAPGCFLLLPRRQRLLRQVVQRQED